MGRPRNAPQEPSGEGVALAEAPEQGEAAQEPQKASGDVAFPTCGRIIHVRITDGEEVVDWDWRPAIVICSDVPGEIGFAEVFLIPDDTPFSHESGLYRNEGKAFYRVRAHLNGDAIGCWRWPPRD